MDRISVASSHLRSVGYNAATQTLEIEFHGSSIYEYFNIPESVYRGLMSASSHGEFFDAHIKKAGYRYRRIR